LTAYTLVGIDDAEVWAERRVGTDEVQDMPIGGLWIGPEFVVKDHEELFSKAGLPSGDLRGEVYDLVVMKAFVWWGFQSDVGALWDAASRAAVGFGRQGCLEIGQVFLTAVEKLTVKAVDELGRVSKHGDHSSIGSECLQLDWCLGAHQVPDGNFANELVRASVREECQVLVAAQFGSAVVEVSAPVVQLFGWQVEIRMSAQPLVHRGGAALWGAKDEEVGAGHCRLLGWVEGRRWRCGCAPA